MKTQLTHGDGYGANDPLSDSDGFAYGDGSLLGDGGGDGDGDGLGSSGSGDGFSDGNNSENGDGFGFGGGGFGFGGGGGGNRNTTLLPFTLRATIVEGLPGQMVNVGVVI